MVMVGAPGTNANGTIRRALATQRRKQDLLTDRFDQSKTCRRIVYF
jgi:hypothetical protein